MIIAKECHKLLRSTRLLTKVGIRCVFAFLHLLYIIIFKDDFLFKTDGKIQFYTNINQQYYFNLFML